MPVSNRTQEMKRRAKHKTQGNLNKASGGDVSSVTQRKNNWSDFVKTTELIQHIQFIIKYNPSKSMRLIAKMVESTVRHVVHVIIKYKSSVTRKRYFISAKPREDRVIRSKRLQWRNLKQSDCSGMLFSDDKVI